MADEMARERSGALSGLLTPARYNVPPGPPVALGAALAVWLFARAELATTLLALLVTALVGIGYVRALREARAAQRTAAAAGKALADLEFALRVSGRVNWAIDLKAHTLTAGDGAETLIGRAFALDDAIKPAPSFIHPEDRGEVVRAHARCLESGEAGPLHIRFLHRDGGVRHVQYCMRARRDGEGALERLFFSAHDYTSVHARGMAVSDMIAAAERQLADTRPELDRLMRRLGLDTADAQVRPDDRAKGFGDGRHFEQASARLQRILKEFEVRQAGFEAAVCALAQARTQTDLLSQAASHSADAMIICDAEGLVAWANSAFEAMSGYRLAEARGRSLGSLLCGPQSDQAAIDEFRLRMEQGEPAACELINYTKDGAPYWVDARATRVLGEDGRLQYVVIVQRDLSARKTMEADLESALLDARDASAAKSRFVANMSHELRTPLNAVIGYAEMLEEDLAALDQAAQAADALHIRTAARHLLALINDVLDLSRIEAGRTDLVPAELDFALLAREVIDTSAALAQANGDALDLVVGDDVGAGFTDAVKVKQCLFNLVSNACKFTHNGRVRVEVARDGAVVRFVVSDTGIGMSAKQLARVFQPFTQADSSTTRRFGGSGLGLAITRRLAQALGGDVTAESVAGQGATFTLSVPVHLGLTEDETCPGAGEAPVVLVIEDDAAARDLALRTISRLGFAGIAAPNGERGLTLAEARAPALILLDVCLPDCDGWSVLARLKENPALADTPVIVVTLDEVGARAIEEGAAAFLQKPVGRDVLAAFIARLAQQRAPLAKAQVIPFRDVV